MTFEEAWRSLAEEVVRVEDSAEMSPQPYQPYQSDAMSCFFLQQGVNLLE